MGRLTKGGRTLSERQPGDLEGLLDRAPGLCRLSERLERTRIQYALAIGILALVANDADRATAGPSASQAASKPPARVLFAYNAGDTFELVVKAGLTAKVEFNRDVSFPKGTHGHHLVRVYPESRGMELRPHRDTPDGTMIDVPVKVGDKTFFFQFTITRGDKGDRLIEVLSIARSVITEEVRKYADPIIDASNKTKDAENLRKRLWLEGKQVFEESSDEPIIRYQLVPNYTVKRSSGDLTTIPTLRPAKWGTETRHVLVPFELEHHDPKAFRLTHVTATKGGEKLWAELVYMYGSSMPTGPPPRPGELLAQVEGQKRIRGAVAVRPDPTTGIKGLTISFSEPKGERWIDLEITGWAVQEVAFAKKKPPPDETVSERVVREAREDANRARRAGQFIVGPIGGIGACWLASGEDGSNADDLAAAACYEFGLRMTYPAFVPKYGGETSIVFEAEVTGGWTEGAGFEGVTLDGVQGDLSRRATFGRGTFGFAVRFGEWKIPYFRLGVGMQAARHRATFSAGVDPDSSFDLGFTWAFGGGIDIRISESLLLGAALSGEAALSSDDNLLRRSLRAGFHVRYGRDR